jgi:hypothetical protein
VRAAGPQASILLRSARAKTAFREGLLAPASVMPSMKQASCASSGAEEPQSQPWTLNSASRSAKRKA